MPLYRFWDGSGEIYIIASGAEGAFRKFGSYFRENKLDPWSLGLVVYAASETPGITGSAMLSTKFLRRHVFIEGSITEQRELEDINRVLPGSKKRPKA